LFARNALGCAALGCTALDFTTGRVIYDGGEL
jgi:hypothetical protein